MGRDEKTIKCVKLLSFRKPPGALAVFRALAKANSSAKFSRKWDAKSGLVRSCCSNPATRLSTAAPISPLIQLTAESISLARLRCLCAFGHSLLIKTGAGGGTRTHTTLPSRDFKSLASTSSATSALVARSDTYRVFFPAAICLPLKHPHLFLHLPRPLT